MERNLPTHLLYQTFLACCLLAFISLGFILTWALLVFRDLQARKRPGINIREL